MRIWLGALFILLTFVLAPPALAAPSAAFADYDLGVNFSLKHNYLAGRDLGQSSSLSNAFIVWNKNQPVISISYLEANHSSESAKFLPLTQNRLDYAASFNAVQNWQIKFTGSELLQTNEESFSANGLYFVRRSRGILKAVEFGAETDNRQKDLYFGYGMFNAAAHDFLVGFSEERTGDDSAERLGTALISNFSENYSTVLGLTKNLSDDKLTKLYGLAKNSPLKPGERNDSFSFVTVLRQKPESDYFLGLFTFNGRSLNKYANQGIFEAMFSGSLSGTRIVGNRNFDRIGLSDAYRVQEYGKAVASVSWGKIKIDENTNLIFDAEEISYTLGDFGKVRAFFVSLGRGGETNLVYNPALHRLEEDYQQYLSAGLGGKLPLRNKTVHFGLANSYNLIQSLWDGVSASFTFSF